MKVIKIQHIDFDLVIESISLDATFNKAQKKEPKILTATTCSVNEGEIEIYNVESK